MASEQPDQTPLQASSEDVTSTPGQPTEQREELSHEAETRPLGAPINVSAEETKSMSKNALKRLRKQQQWEEEKEDRKRRRKEKRQDVRIRKREEKKALIAQGINPHALHPRKPAPVNVPVAIVLDCDFEKYMSDKELISLGAQITRSYSENRQAPYRPHLWVSGWGGRLAERFRTVLDHHRNWRGIDFVDGDFVECAEKARDFMRERGGTMTDALRRSLDDKVSWVRDEADPFPLPDPEPEPTEEYKDVVYLSSDSPYTLERLEPNTSYVIGGLVDKNREKGLCYKRARERGIRTARLPIRQYMVMQSRQVLATNHVVEIMLKWLEYEDWGKAFLSVIPKRKGGRLREQGSAEGADAEKAGEEEEDDGDELEETEGQGAQGAEERDSDQDVADAPATREGREIRPSGAEEGATEKS